MQLIFGRLALEAWAATWEGGIQFVLSGSRHGNWNTDGCETGICNMCCMQSDLHMNHFCRR
jgi:hypothetical protein